MLADHNWTADELDDFLRGKGDLETTVVRAHQAEHLLEAWEHDHEAGEFA